MEDRNGNQDLNYAIELRDVHKSFQVGDEELPILKGISTAIEPGETVALPTIVGQDQSSACRSRRPMAHPYWLASTASCLPQ
jgi:ABC-type dipeptide/oligopeptide/nickel transport system ATPase subunit